MKTHSVNYTTCVFDYDPEKMPREIDKILVSPNFILNNYKTIKTNCRGRSPFSHSGSDHFPVIATLISKELPSRKPSRKSRKPSRKKKKA